MSEEIRRAAFAECAAIARKHAEKWRNMNDSRFNKAIHIEADIKAAGGLLVLEDP